MGLMDALGGGLTALAQAKTGQLQGEQQGSALMRAIQGQQIQWEKEKAETALTNRKIATPILGEDAYAKAHGAVAGAEAAAKSPIETQTAINTAQGVAPIHTQQAIDTAKGVAPIDVQKHYDEALAVLPLELQKQVAAGQISLANGIQLAHVHGGIQAGLQQNAQTFQAGQQDRAHTFQHGERQDAQAFQATQQKTGLAGHYANTVGENNIKENGGIVAPIVRKLTGKPQPVADPALAPSNGLGATAPGLRSQNQKLYDDAVALHGADKVQALYGPRPE